MPSIVWVLGAGFSRPCSRTEQPSFGIRAPLSPCRDRFQSDRRVGPLDRPAVRLSACSTASDRNAGRRCHGESPAHFLQQLPHPRQERPRLRVPARRACPAVRLDLLEALREDARQFADSVLSRADVLAGGHPPPVRSAYGSVDRLSFAPVAGAARAPSRSGSVRWRYPRPGRQRCAWRQVATTLFGTATDRKKRRFMLVPRRGPSCALLLDPSRSVLSSLSGSPRRSAAPRLFKPWWVLLADATVSPSCRTVG
jgi:hypothetical protein